MNSNFLICRNAVYVEDIYVGQFESFEYRADSRTLGSSAVLTMPLYAIGLDDTGRARSRMRSIFVTPDGETFSNLIMPASEVKVWCWYESWNADLQDNEAHERILVFSGFIEHVAEGFPTKIYLQDNSFILRFGGMDEWWTGDNTLQKIVEDVIPVAQAGFDEERKVRGLTRDVPKLTYSTEMKNVQAFTDPISFREFGGGSPFDIIQRLMSTLVLYGGVSRDFNVYVGALTTKSTRPIMKLDTRANVIERDIVPMDGRFISYDVKVTGILKESGKRWTAIGGRETTRSGEKDTHFESAYGESYRGFTPADTRKGIQDAADRLLQSLRGERNAGKIQLLLYPKLDILDSVEYTDTVFEELSAVFCVLGYEFKADDKGFFQTLNVTDDVFKI